MQDFRYTRVDPYRFGHDLIVARKANRYDPPNELCPLIYNTDPYIYAGWFGEYNETTFATLQHLILTDRTLFSLDNLYVVRDYNRDKIAALACLIEWDTPLDYNYEVLKHQSDNARDVIDGYVKPLINQAAYLKPRELLLVNFCVASEYRQHNIGSFFLQSLIQAAKQQSYRKLTFDCLADNETAIRLYVSCGCQIVDTGKGFALGPNLPNVVVFELKL